MIVTINIIMLGSGVLVAKVYGMNFSSIMVLIPDAVANAVSILVER